MGISKYVPPGKGQPAPEPPNAQDTEIIEGPHRMEIAEKLDDLTAIAEIDWQYRHVIPHRNAIFVALAALGVTQGRMKRAYAIDGTPIITHVGIVNILGRQKKKEESK